MVLLEFLLRINVFLVKNKIASNVPKIVDNVNNVNHNFSLWLKEVAFIVKIQIV